MTHGCEMQGSAPAMAKGKGMNVPQKQQAQSLAHSLYSSSKIAVEFEDEEG